ncbi:MAG TPA: ATP-binding protein [Thermoanaerobaculia bacterium]|nr:ATP-binding protein [Thermoanaerobaculia bacterium]
MDEPAVPVSCPVCRGFGRLERPDGSTVPCECRAEEISRVRRAAARIPERYRNCRLQNFKDLRNESLKKAKAVAKRWVEEWPAVDAGLLITGPVGVGKTHLAVAILNELVDTKGASALFCDFSDLLDRIQASFGKGNDESQDDIVAPYRDADLLVLDELGARRPSDWVREILYGLLNTRYNRRRLTILTTNFADEPDARGGETLEVRVGAPVRSRLWEMTQLVPINADDFRKAHGARAFG